MRKQQGFTLVEIAIVLVIIGLLLGGILRGQELIQGARVRNVIEQQNGVRAAFFAFQDRYRAIPGDLTVTQVNLIGSGVLGAVSFAGSGTIDGNDSPIAFQNLTATNFLSCSVCTGIPGNSSAGNSPSNVYGGVLQFITDAAYMGGTAAAPIYPSATNATNIKTGQLIPSNVMLEIDVKSDDGSPATGNLRFSAWGGPTQANCSTTINAVVVWMTNAASIAANCGGATLL
jgi:prepilin-type N-terminal cleavage/methylation domain-containing protein